MLSVAHLEKRGNRQKPKGRVYRSGVEDEAFFPLSMTRCIIVNLDQGQGKK